MEIITLFLVIIILMCFSLCATNGDILSPAFVVETVYLIAAIIMVVTWEIKFEWRTVCVIVLGLAAFQIMESFFYFEKPRRIVQKEIIISNGILVLIVLIQIITVVMYSLEIKRIGGKGLYESIKLVRRQNMYATSLGMSQYVNLYVSRLMKINYAAGYVNLYFLVNKLEKKQKGMQSALLFVSVGIYLLQALFSGGRMQFLRLGLALIIFILVNYRQMHNNQKHISVKKIIKASIFLAIGLILFYETRVIVGRTNQVSYSFWDVLSTYFSGGLYLFNEYMKNPIINNGDSVGTQTFKDLFNLLYKYGFREYRIVPQLEFRKVGKTFTNTYTAFRYYYQDYGIIGVLILQMVYSFVFNSLYRKIKLQMNQLIIPIYGFMFFGLVMHVVSDQFFSILSFGYVETILHMCLIIYLETKIKFSYKQEQLVLNRSI